MSTDEGIEQNHRVRVDMKQPKTLRMSIRFNVLMLLLMLCLFVVSSLFSYQRHRALITKVVRNDARIIAGEVAEAMGETQHPILPQEAGFPGSHQPAELQKLVNRITAPDKYLIGILSFDPESKIFRPSELEAAELRLLKGSRSDESFRYIRENGESRLLYMRALRADERCLACHGPYESAPSSVRALFPAGSTIYGHSNGDVMGAVAVTVPTSEFLDETWWNLYDGIFIKLFLFLIIVLFVGSIIRRRIIDPVVELTETVSKMTKEGVFTPVTPTGADADIQALVQAYNELMAELQQRTDQYRESEQRYRTIMEMFDAPIVTFLGNGKIILSNSKVEQLLGLSKDALLGENFFSYLETGLAVQGRLPSCVEGKPERGVRIRGRVKVAMGGSIEVDILISALDCQNGMYAAILWEISDAVT